MAAEKRGWAVGVESEKENIDLMEGMLSDGKGREAGREACLSQPAALNQQCRKVESNQKASPLPSLRPLHPLRPLRVSVLASDLSNRAR